MSYVHSPLHSGLGRCEKRWPPQRRQKTATRKQSNHWSRSAGAVSRAGTRKVVLRRRCSVETRERHYFRSPPSTAWSDDVPSLPSERPPGLSWQTTALHYTTHAKLKATHAVRRSMRDPYATSHVDAVGAVSGKKSIARHHTHTPPLTMSRTLSVVRPPFPIVPHQAPFTAAPPASPPARTAALRPPPLLPRSARIMPFVLRTSHSPCGRPAGAPQVLPSLQNSA